MAFWCSRHLFLFDNEFYIKRIVGPVPGTNLTTNDSLIQRRGETLWFIVFFWTGLFVFDCTIYFLVKCGRGSLTPPNCIFPTNWVSLDIAWKSLEHGMEWLLSGFRSVLKCALAAVDFLMAWASSTLLQFEITLSHHTLVHHTFAPHIWTTFLLYTFTPYFCTSLILCRCKSVVQKCGAKVWCKSVAQSALRQEKCLVSQ